MIRNEKSATGGTVILSCATLLNFVDHAQRACGTDYPVVELDRQYHVEPSLMRTHILKTLSELPDETDTVLVAMGFCGGSWQDVACSRTLVIPRVTDCVALTLTTPQQYAPDLKQPGHMYLFGEGRNGFSISDIYNDLLAKHDRAEADAIFDGYFEHYHHLDIVDNGLYDCYDPDYVEQAQLDADRIHAELDFVPGSNILLEKLVSGNCDRQFLVVPPGIAVTQALFFDC